VLLTFAIESAQISGPPSEKPYLILNTNQMCDNGKTVSRNQKSGKIEAIYKVERFSNVVSGKNFIMNLGSGIPYAI
jgi:hypothetical protein